MGLSGKQIRYLWAIGYFKSGGHKGVGKVVPVTVKHRTEAQATTHVLEVIDKIDSGVSAKVLQQKARQALLIKRRDRVIKASDRIDDQLFDSYLGARQAGDLAGIAVGKAKRKVFQDKSLELQKKIDTEIYNLKDLKAPRIHDYLREVTRQQGFDGLPTLHTEDQITAKAKSGDLEIFRGAFTDHDTGTSASQFHDQLRRGKFYMGSGVYGQGTYVSPDIGTAEGYSSMDGGAILRGVINKNAKVITHSEALRMFTAAVVKHPKLSQADESTFAASMGYDVLHVAQNKSGVQMKNGGHRVILNRKVLSLEDAPVYKYKVD